MRARFRGCHLARTDWFVYGHLHLILAIPTLAILYLSPPLQSTRPLQKQAALAFVGFIVVVGVVQSYIWDAYGATLGIWEFNPAKCTLREEFPLPVEEVLWLFHHVTKTALYQCARARALRGPTGPPARPPSGGSRAARRLSLSPARARPAAPLSARAGSRRLSWCRPIRRWARRRRSCGAA